MFRVKALVLIQVVVSLRRMDDLVPSQSGVDRYPPLTWASIQSVGQLNFQSHRHVNCRQVLGFQAMFSEIKMRFPKVPTDL